MKKIVLLLLGFGFAGMVGIGVLFVGLIAWAQQSGSRHQEKWFEAVLSGNTQQVIAQLDPALMNEIDEPVLAAWMEAVDKYLGSFKGLSPTSFHTNSKYENGVSVTESKGTVEFSKGVAESELVLRNDKIIKFNVQSKALPAGWFQGPKNDQLYKQRAEQFLTHFVAGDPAAAFAMMHESLQKDFPLDRIKQVNTQAKEGSGKIEKLEFVSAEFDNKNGEHLRLNYTIQFEKHLTKAVVDFQFVGLKGHLVAFNLTTE